MKFHGLPYESCMPMLDERIDLILLHLTFTPDMYRMSIARKRYCYGKFLPLFTWDDP